MITAPRSNPTLRQSLRELRRAGFSQTIHLFAEPGSDVAALPPGVELFRNSERLGAWRNWRQAATRLMELSGSSALLICEDDIRLATDASLALQHAIETLDHDDLGYLSLYTPWQNVLGASLNPGWQALVLGDRARGALAYCFTRPGLRSVLQATPADESAGQVHADIGVTTALESAGRHCWFHIPSLCDHAASDTSTLGHPAQPLIAGFEFRPRRRIYRADLSTKLPGPLAVVTSYYNPARCEHRSRNYREFSKHVAACGGELWTAEVAFGEQPFQLPPGRRMLQLRSDDVLWQKEQALNVLIRRLPPEYDKVAWVDADVIFDDPDWLRGTATALERSPVVQCFSDVDWLDETGQPEASMKSAAADPSSWIWGSAWAAHRDLLERFGLFATDVSTCNDALCYLAFSGQLDHPFLDSYPHSVRESLNQWHDQLWPEVQGELGVVDGRICHLYHGKLDDRRHAERIKSLTEQHFDPSLDLVVLKNGLLGWSGRNPGLEDRVREFLTRRPSAVATRRGPETYAVRRALPDPLERADIQLPEKRLKARRCIATVATPEWKDWLNGFLASLAANADCDDALKVVFLVGESAACEQLAKRYRAEVVKCSARRQVGPSIKSILYSVAHVVDADTYLCLDVDTRILNEIRSLFGALEVCRSDAVLVARDGLTFQDLADVLVRAYGGQVDDLRRLCSGPCEDVARYPLVVNDGVFAARRETLIALDRAVRDMPEAVAWIDEDGPATLRNQFLFNLFLAQHDCAVKLDRRFNAQYHDPDAKLVEGASGLQATVQGGTAHIVHLTTPQGKREFLRWEKSFRGRALPTLPRGRDGYAEFLAAVRQWVQLKGETGLDGTFYGNMFQVAPRVRDPGTCSLWGTLFHVIRAHGCAKVLETGTFCGISTGCLASAVVDRAGAQVVTIDVDPQPDRHEFWQLLPKDTKSILEERRLDSLAALAAALETGERYHAALLDTVHTAEFVLQEFDLARQLVEPGGLILIHDIHPAFFDTWKAIDEIQSRGYGVVRLWCADQAVQTDDRLGLALIENHSQGFNRMR